MAKKKVWVITERYSDKDDMHSIHGVYSAQEKAQMECEKQGGWPCYEIEEWIVE